MSTLSAVCTKLTHPLCAAWSKVATALQHLAPAADFAARVYIAKVFISSGLVKINDWNSTLLLFREEYQVPLLPPELAATLATAGELVLPVLLLIGLFTRFAALGLYILNIVAVTSYYSALKDSPAALQSHLVWGLLLGMLMTTTIYRWTLDAWWQGRCTVCAPKA